jgi:hypothetical protein
MEAPAVSLRVIGLEGGGEGRPGRHQPQARRHLCSERRESIPQIPDQRMPMTEIACATHRFEPAHRPYPPLQMLLIPFQPVVQVFRRAMLHVGQGSAQGRRVAFGLITRHPRRGHGAGVDGYLEKRLGCGRVAPVAKVDIDDLPVLVDRSVEVVPALANLDIGLVDPPAPSNRRTMRACGTDRVGDPAGPSPPSPWGCPTVCLRIDQTASRPPISSSRLQCTNLSTT